MYEKTQLVEYLLSYEQRRLEYDLTEWERESERACASEWMCARYLAPLGAPNASWDILCGTFWRLRN